MDNEEKDNELLEIDSEPVPQNPVVQVRKAKKKKKGARSKKEYEVQVIPATKGVTPTGEVAQLKRVAAYCRVSTDQEAQSSSYELQVKLWIVFSQQMLFHNSLHFLGYRKMLFHTIPSRNSNTR